MKTSLLFSTALLLAGTALADVNYNMARDQAKRGANSGNAQQPQSPGSSAPQAPPTDPALAATLKNVADLRADIAALVKADDATAAADQRMPLLNHLSAAAQGTKASAASVKKLAGDLIAAVSAKAKLTGKEVKLARGIHALFNGAHLSATQQQTLLGGIKKTLTEAGVADDDADKVTEDLTTVAAETK